MTDSSQRLISLNNLSVTIHGKPVLNDLNITIDKGAVLGVIGESGSGKSMTALAIMGLLPSGSSLAGSIRFEELALNELGEVERSKVCGNDISMVFQEPMTALNPVHNIGEQVIECIRLHENINYKAAKKVAHATLIRCGLPPEEFPLSRYPHELSGGQRQRVVIAMAIASKPKLLIADEPTTALDVTTQADILELLRDLQQEHNMALMLISHELAVVANMADKVVIMKDGNIIEQDETVSIFSRLSHPYTKALFEASRHVPDRATKFQSANANANSVTPLLEVSNLVCEYPASRRGWLGRGKKFRAVDDVSFCVMPGESVGLVGESGCGKSTLTRAVLGLMKVSQGNVSINSVSAFGERGVRRNVLSQVQVVFQDPYSSFNPRHKVSRLVAEPLHIFDPQPTSAERHQRVVAMLVSVGLRAEDCDKYIHEFSGGQRQRIAIARALVTRPQLIILDEAVSALDVSIRATVLDLLASLAKSHGLAYLFISHDLSVVRNVTDRVLVMRFGKIVERGKTADVFDYPTHEYTQRLVASVPRLPDYTDAYEY